METRRGEHSSRGLALYATQLFRLSENPHGHEDIPILWVALDAEQGRGRFVGELHHHLLGRLYGRAEIQEIPPIVAHGQAGTLIVDGQLFAPLTEVWCVDG